MNFVDPARSTALRLLWEVETSAVSLDPLFARLEDSSLDQRDRRFVRQLVLGILRWQGRIDWIVDQFARRPIASCSPWARQILRLGTYQLLWLDRVPARAAVHTSVELAKRFTHPGIATLVNAVLRGLLRQADRIQYPCRQEDLAVYLAVYHSHPRWLVERWLARWGEEQTEAMLRANNNPAPLYLRLNPLRIDAAGLLARLQADGLAVRPAGPLPGYFEVVEAAGLFDSSAYRAGLFQVQDINAGLAVALLDPRPGEQVLDTCSAPGGKTTQIAIAMQDQGLIVAADLSPSRLRRVLENAARLHLNSIHPVAEDARQEGETGIFDRVLTDVPCSGTGTLCRRPDIRWRRHLSQLSERVALQEAILHQAFTRLRPGGVLVYSTCSLEEEENTSLVDRFLAATPAAQLEPASRWFPGQPWAQRYLQTQPGRDPGDGSFAARIRKVDR